jgi:hypothetical protein
MSWLDDVIVSGIGSLRRDLGTESRGLWNDFELTSEGFGSTEWVSAFIAAQIGAIPEGRALAAGVVETILSRARETGGWGFRDDVPEDCDSTAWVLLAATTTGVVPSADVVNRSTRFIVEHQNDSGGFVTFGSEVRKLLDAPGRASWFEPEVSVTSAALLALASVGYGGTERLRRAQMYLSRHRTGDMWESHWWNGFAYPTYLALSSLLLAGRERHGAEVREAAQAIRLRQRGTGVWANGEGLPDNGFCTSFALRALLITDEDSAHGDVAMDSVTWLAGLLTRPGPCPASAEMLFPGGFVGPEVVVRDKGSVTTACVVRALHEARTALRGAV